MLDMIISLFRDGISGTRYIIYVIICSTLLFSIVGYLLKQKYGKVEFKVASAQTSASKPKKEKKVKTKTPKKSKAVKGASQVVTPVAQTQVPAPAAAQTVQKPAVQVAQPQQPVQTPSPVQQQVPTQVQQSAPVANQVVSKVQIPAQQQVAPQAAVTSKQPASIPDLSQSKTGNPAIDDDITTVI